MQHPAPAPKQTSPWAIAALMCSLVIVCPLATVLGPLLGLKAIAEIRARPDLKGTRLAATAIAIGIAATLTWIALPIWLNVSVRQPILAGPEPELHAGLRSDVAGFKEGFTGRAAELPDEHAIAFLDELTRRYGNFHSLQQAPPDPDAPPPDPQQRDYIVPYVLTFDRGLMEAEAAFVPFERMRPVGKWRWIVIKDDELGDLRYP